MNTINSEVVCYTFNTPPWRNQIYKRMLDRQQRKIFGFTLMHTLLSKCQEADLIKLNFNYPDQSIVNKDMKR